MFIYSVPLGPPLRRRAGEYHVYICVYIYLSIYIYIYIYLYISMYIYIYIGASRSPRVYSVYRLAHTME